MMLLSNCQNKISEKKERNRKKEFEKKRNKKNQLEKLMKREKSQVHKTLTE